MAASPPPVPRSAARNLYAFGLTSFFNDTASEMAYWVLPAFLASIGAGPAQLGVIEGVAESVALLAMVTWWGQVLAIRFVDRSAKGARGTARDVMVAESVPSDRMGSAYGLIQ